MRHQWYLAELFICPSRLLFFILWCPQEHKITADLIVGQILILVKRGKPFNIKRILKQEINRNWIVKTISLKISTEHQPPEFCLTSKNKKIKTFTIASEANIQENNSALGLIFVDTVKALLNLILQKIN